MSMQGRHHYIPIFYLKHCFLRGWPQLRVQQAPRPREAAKSAFHRHLTWTGPILFTDCHARRSNILRMCSTKQQMMTRRERFAICLSGGSLPSGQGYWHARPVRLSSALAWFSDGGLVPVFFVLRQFCEIGAIVTEETRDSASF